jgi:hypothetical protein
LKIEKQNPQFSFNKTGIKFWILTEVSNKYFVNCVPYLGKDELRPKDKLQGEYVVTKLIENYTNMG